MTTVEDVGFIGVQAPDLPAQNKDARIPEGIPPTARPQTPLYTRYFTLQNIASGGGPVATSYAVAVLETPSRLLFFSLDADISANSLGEYWRIALEASLGSRVIWRTGFSIVDQRADGAGRGKIIWGFPGLIFPAGTDFHVDVSGDDNAARIYCEVLFDRL